MIYITQGHEKGIGLEIFLRSFQCLNPMVQAQFKLFVSKATLIDHFNFLNIKNYKLEDSQASFLGNKLHCQYVEEAPLSKTALDKALETIKEHYILITLPTSKDQLPLNEMTCKGYTEYLRHKFNDSNLSMNFIADNEYLTLLTDHIPVKNITSSITSDLVEQKIARSLTHFRSKLGIQFNEVIFAGINPHAGEGGLLGTEEEYIRKGIARLKFQFPDIKFLGPMPGDTLHHHKNSSTQLFVYAHHDQGLAPFKQKNNFIGINLTLGLPFLRFSVDHGTAFSLFGEGNGNLTGMQYLLSFCLKQLAE